MDESAARRSENLAALSGFAALLVGIGIGRFGYPPLIPVIVREGMVTANAANVAAATNFLGYLAGALIAAFVAEKLGVKRTLILALAATTVSFAACALPGTGAVALAAWRFVSGLTGGLLMIITPRFVMAAVPAERRGIISGLMFGGVGLGIVISGAALPAIGSRGGACAFLFLGVLTGAASLVSWRLMPKVQPVLPRLTGVSAPHWRGPLLGLAAAYCGFGAGFAGHTIFMVDYISRGLGRGDGAGSAAWVLMGLGSIGGVIFWGRLADRFGAPLVLRIAQTSMAAFVALAALTTSSAGLYTSVFGAGVCGLALGSLTAMRAAELVDLADYTRTWALLTIVFSLCQAAGGYALAWIFAQSGSYPLVFGLCAAVLITTITAEYFLARKKS